MKRLLNTLYVTSGNKYLSLDGENVVVLEEKQAILACGAGASTKRVWNLPDGYHIERCENVKDIKQYIARIDEMIERKKALFEKD